MAAPPAVRLEHVAGGCNRIVGALDWGESGLIAFATHNAIAVYDPQACSRPVLATLLGHAGAVTCLRWLRASHFGLAALLPASPLALVSGGADGAVCLWLLPPPPSAAPWTLAATLPAHTAPLTSLTLHADPAAPGRVLLVTTAGDGDVAVWSAAAGGPEALFSPEAWRQDQRMAYGTRIQHCAALAPLPTDPGAALLALGGVDGRVRLLLRPGAPGAPFRPVCELEGHQNWVRGLDLTRQGARLLLASAAQDRCVRLWTVGPEGGAAAAADPLTRLAPRPRFRCPDGGSDGGGGGRWYAAAAEALLLGHEDWVHSVAWKPRLAGEESEPPCLLSASMDRTMALWVADAATGLWLSAESVGDAGVNHLGYYTGVWSPDGAAIAAHGYTGALHVWRRAGDGGLVPAPAAGGHCAAVVDAAWAADGGCLLTVSADQTARITARLASTGAWCEIGRPQVHGHDFSCVAAIPGSIEGEEGRFLYASGSEEKVIRVFEAPQTFHDTLALARGRGAAAGAASAPATPAAFGATLPALGLSNKAVYSAEEAAERDSGAAEPGLGGGEYNAAGPDVAPAAAPSAVAGPPLEEHLAGSTLWPEIHKLYGHGNELHCLAAAPGGQVLASACRAQSAPVAAIMLWDTATWTPRASLPAHALTVTQLAFSPDGAALASVSRDRSVAVFRRPPGAPPDSLDYEMSVHLPRAHARIVWGVGWAPDSALLATASRDGTAKLWAAKGSSLEPLASVGFGEGVHAVAFAPRELPAAAGAAPRRRCLAAVGLESGTVVVGVVEWSIGGSGAAEGQGGAEAAWAEAWRTPATERHAAAVRRVCWRAADGAQRYELASCGDDHGLRVFAVDGAAAAAAAAAAGGAAP